MITPNKFDNNKAKDVPGPVITPNYDRELQMSDMSGSATNVLEKCPLSSLHDGDKESPLSASGDQAVVVKASMGSDMADHKPMVAKGSTRDESHNGKSEKGNHKY